MSSPELLERVRAATAGEYVIERELGRGGMAAVFLARDLALDRLVAIKVMLPDLIGVEGTYDRFVVEARTAANLDHPAIVAVHAVKRTGDTVFIVMKYVEGNTLDDMLRDKGQLDSVTVASIGARVAEALHFAHSKGIVHRDVKPSNIIMGRDGRPVVTDFGIAKVANGRSITVTGSVLGTPTYMSPEQCRGEVATTASDQYSLGVMLYEMLTGSPPFKGSFYELITAHCTTPVPALAARTAGSTDPALLETIERMLAKKAEDRFDSLATVAS